MRTTKGERAAIGQLVEAWKAERTAGNGGTPNPGDGDALWFRLLVRKLATDAGLTIEEEPAPAPAPKKPTAKKRAK